MVGQRTWRDALPYWVLVAFLIFAFLTGGSSRAETQSFIILRPVAILVCGYALWRLSWATVRAHAFLFVMAAALFGLALLHLVPLPPGLWRGLAGRGILAEVDQLAGLGDVWRPLSMVPSGAWNAFFSLFVPLAVLLLGVQLNREERFALLPVVGGLGLFSGLVGLLQVIGDPQGPLYLYSLTNNGSAVGLFANRNHQATLLACLFPMLAVYASAGVRTIEQAKMRGGIAFAAGVVLVPLILVTGSRAGLIAGIIGLLSVALLYRRPAISIPAKRKTQQFDPRLGIAAFTVICLGALTVIMSRAEAFKRLSQPDQTEDMRFQVWGPIVDMGWTYFPFGSGLGSFTEVYQIAESNTMLSLNYVNRAHNDFVETWLVAGVPGVLLIAITMVVAVKAAWPWFRRKVAEGRDVSFGRLGFVILLLLGLASIGDYPLRQPSLMCLFVVAALWLAGDRSSTGQEG